MKITAAAGEHGCGDRNAESPLCLRASAGQPAVSSRSNRVPVQFETKKNTAVKKKIFLFFFFFFLEVPSASRRQTVFLLLFCNIVCKDRETANLFIVFCKEKTNSFCLPDFLFRLRVSAEFLDYLMAQVHARRGEDVWRQATERS